MSERSDNDVTVFNHAGKRYLIVQGDDTDAAFDAAEDYVIRVNAIIGTLLPLRQRLASSRTVGDPTGHTFGGKTYDPQRDFVRATGDGQDRIELEDMTWARDFALWSAERMSSAM